MLHNPDKKTKIDLPEELLCAYVDGQTTPQEDREMLEMLAADDNLAMLHDDLKTIMDIINMEDEEMTMAGSSDLDDAIPDSGFAIDEETLTDCNYCSSSVKPVLKDLDDELDKKDEDEKEKEELRRAVQERIEKEIIMERCEVRPRLNHYYNDEETPKASQSSTSIFGRMFSRSFKRKSSTHSRITPHTVNTLQPNEIFVFGSNPWGLHNGGASKLAKSRFGAIQGQGEGRQGQSYAIPTIVGGVENVRPHVNQFIQYAKTHPELHFIVTRIGCGTAGFNPEDIAPLFIEAKNMSNISLPLDFWHVINGL